MRLTNINCPQCNGRLNQQEDKFYCTSCGSAFNIDYEESDVEYARLITEPERTRLHLENNRILLEKNAELRRKFLIGEMKDTFKQEVKTAGVTYAGGAIYAAIISIIGVLAGFGLIAMMFLIVWKNTKINSEKREQARIERIESLSVEDIESDRNFLENAIAGGITSVIKDRDDPITENADGEGDAYLVGSPVPVNCYLIKTGLENHLCIVYKITYEFSENKATKVIYDCVFFENIELDETGHIIFTNNYGRVYGDGRDDHWEGYEDPDGIYEDDSAFPFDYEFFKVDI